MNLLIGWAITTIAVMTGSYLIPGVEVDSISTAVIVAVVLGLINIFIKPILIILTLPITIVTLGLFLLILNALVILFVDSLIPGFSVAGLWPAILFSIVISVVSWIAGSLTK